MAAKRRQHSAEFKFRVALAAVREVNTVSELASQHDVHPTLIRKWKQQLLRDGPQVFVQSEFDIVKVIHFGPFVIFEK